LICDVLVAVLASIVRIAQLAVHGRYARPVRSESKPDAATVALSILMRLFQAVPFVMVGIEFQRGLALIEVFDEATKLVG
jgi:hypothetical protein